MAVLAAGMAVLAAVVAVLAAVVAARVEAMEMAASARCQIRHCSYHRCLRRPLGHRRV